MRVIHAIGKLLTVGLAVLVIVAAAVFAVSNREPVTLNLWPFDPLSLPLGAVVLGALALGLVLGAGLISLSRLRARWRARRSEQRAVALEQAVARGEAAARAPAPGTALAAPRARTALSDD